MSTTFRTRITAVSMGLGVMLATAACDNDSTPPDAVGGAGSTQASSPAAGTTDSGGPKPHIAVMPSQEAAPSPVAPYAGSTGTEITVVHVFGASGKPAQGWKIEDPTDDSPISCDAGSGAVRNGNGYTCGSSADMGVACVADPEATDEVVCVTDPVKKEGFRRTVESLPKAGPAPITLPLLVALSDGSTYTLRSGGAANESPEGMVPYYWCAGDGCTDALWGDPEAEPFETSDSDAWVAYQAPESGKKQTHAVDVRQVWFVSPEPAS